MFLQMAGVPYDLVEAWRRVRTYHFTGVESDYYDVRATRLPHTCALKLTFNPFDKLGCTGKYDREVISNIMNTGYNFGLFNGMSWSFPAILGGRHISLT